MFAVLVRPALCKVPMDIPNLLLQMGVDVFARMESFFRRGRFPE